MIRDFKSPLDPSPPKPRSLSWLEQSRTKYIEKNELSFCEHMASKLCSVQIIRDNPVTRCSKASASEGVLSCNFLWNCAVTSLLEGHSDTWWSWVKLHHKVHTRQTQPQVLLYLFGWFSTRVSAQTESRRPRHQAIIHFLLFQYVTTNKWPDSSDLFQAKWHL